MQLFFFSVVNDIIQTKVSRVSARASTKKKTFSFLGFFFWQFVLMPWKKIYGHSDHFDFKCPQKASICVAIDIIFFLNY
jgi:hypothetical protein